MDRKKGISIAINEIKEIGFAYKPLPLPVDEIELGKNLTFGMRFQFEIDSEKELFKFQTNIQYLIDGYEGSYLDFSNIIVFKVLNISDALKEENGEIIEVNDNLITSLMAVCIGTTRGLLAASTKGTDWARFPVPILDPKQVVKDMNKNSDK